MGDVIDLEEARAARMTPARYAEGCVDPDGLIVMRVPVGADVLRLRLTIADAEMWARVLTTLAASARAQEGER